jgi:ATP-dependent DNA helicase RecG
VDWGSYAYQCTKEQLEKLMEQTGCEIDKMNELASEKIYGDPRNPNILKMFGFVNVGERAGSGVDKIMTAWAEQNWKKPEFDFSERSDRVTLKLEVGQVVYIPGAADIRNENTNQEKATAVSKEDKIIEYIRQNGSISSQKAADIGGYKSKTGARKLLDKMIEKGLITKIGNGPATKYVI